jgi:hypothetical protein
MKTSPFKSSAAAASHVGGGPTGIMAREVKIATLVVGHTVVMLEDGTTILVTVKPKTIRALLGQKDGEGRQAYELDNEMLIANITPPKT